MNRHLERYELQQNLGIRWNGWLVAWLLLFAFRFVAVSSEMVQVPRGIDHAPYDTLLKRYVDTNGLVNYAAWKASPQDMKALVNYTARFGSTEPFADGAERVTSLINAYNALTLLWILENYPTHGIRELKGSFSAERHLVGGERVSLDDIEHGTLRPLVGYRVHAAVVCAARSCPPLRREAYTPESLDLQLDEAMRRWIARDDLNRFDGAKKEAHLSRIFKWYREDFERAGGLKQILAKYGPADAQVWIPGNSTKIRFLEYHWELNGQTAVGKDSRTLWQKIF
ncbi:MAG: DUF547 domain-containing protein [Verrucomicrobiales bacterium]|nr:DUF547 domain-containing protein [Verrucomicrobiales bacterium]